MVFLEVRLLEGSNLFAFESSGLANHKAPNAFVEFRLVERQEGEDDPKKKLPPPVIIDSVKSRPIKKSRHPKWNDVLFLDLKEHKDMSKLRLCVLGWTKGFLGRVKPMGECRLKTSLEVDKDAQKVDALLKKTGKGSISFKVSLTSEKHEPKVIKSGTMWMLGGWRDSAWEMRWFELNDNGLYWYAGNKKEQPLGGESFLYKCEITTEMEALKKLFLPGVFLIKTPRGIQYTIRAALIGHSERDEWVEALQKLAEKQEKEHADHKTDDKN